MSSSGARRGGRGSRQLQFAVGHHRWRHVAVVDAGCGCRPRRATTRLLNQLPSFLRPSSSSATKPHQPVVRSSSRSSSGFFPSSASTASSATFATTHSSSAYSAYSTAAAHAYSYKQHQEDPALTRAPSASSRLNSKAAVMSASSSRKPRHHAAGSTSTTTRTRKKRYEKMTAAPSETADVGVAVEKESSDPRADFRDSMVQMVLETGLCGWDDLRCMLRRLLALNAPRHHAAILAAFAEVCAQLTAPPEPQEQEEVPAGYGYQCHAYDDYSYQY